MSIELNNLSFFSGIHQEKLDRLSDCSTLQHFMDGQVILRKGKIATGFYVVLSGHVSVEEVAPGLGSLHLQTISHGDALGWSWMPPFRQWHFNAIALGNVSALWFDGEMLEVLIHEDPDLGRELIGRLLDVLTNRIKHLRIQIKDWQQPTEVL